MKRYVLGLGLVVSSGCAQLTGQFDVGSISVSDAMSVGSDLYKAASLSDEEVVEMSRQVAKHYDSTNKIAPSSSPYAKRLARLVSKYQNEDGLTLNYKVYMSPEVNAFSLADGTIRVYSGLMDKLTDDELLFVIGHEIGHVKGGHSKVRMQRAYAASAAVRAAGAGASAAAGSTVGGIGVALAGDALSSLAAEVVTAQFSQGDETESDEYGLRFMNKGGHQPAAAVAALVKLGDDTGAEGSAKGNMFHRITSSHPDPLARAEHIRSLIPGLPAPGASVVMASTSTVETNDADVAPVAEDDKVPPSDGGVKVASDTPAQPTTYKAYVPKDPAAVEPRRAPPQKVLAAGDWVIQVGSFADMSRAQKVVATLVQQSRPAWLEEVAIDRGTFHRVVVGPYPSRDEAMQRLVDMESGQLIGEGSFVRRAVK